MPAMAHVLVKMKAYTSNFTKIDAIVSISSEFYPPMVRCFILIRIGKLLLLEALDIKHI